jgi:hypothetical protein
MTLFCASSMIVGSATAFVVIFRQEELMLYVTCKPVRQSAHSSARLTFCAGLTYAAMAEGF